MRNMKLAGPKCLTPLGEVVVGLLGAVALSWLVYEACVCL